MHETAIINVPVLISRITTERLAKVRRGSSKTVIFKVDTPKKGNHERREKKKKR